MKKTILTLTLVSIAAFAAIISCTKSYNNNGIVVPVTPSLNQLFSAFRSTPQSFTINAGRDTVVYAAKGTMLHFYTYSFKDASGNVISDGIINLQLTEMYRAGDMISNRATTSANGQILQSGGQVTMTATMDGAQVFANRYGIGFEHANSSTASMSLFYGGSSNADSVITWTVGDTTNRGNNANGTIADTSGSHSNSYFYFDTCTSFTWANCDWFYSNDSSETSVSIILPDSSFNESNTQMCLVLPIVNYWGGTTDTFFAVLSNAQPSFGTATYNASTHTMNLLSEGHTSVVPEGMKYDLVVIANKNGTYYYYEQSGNIPHNGLLANVPMTVQTESYITAQLQTL